MPETHKEFICFNCIDSEIKFSDSLMARMYQLTEVKEKIFEACNNKKNCGRCSLLNSGEKAPNKIELMEYMGKVAVRNFCSESGRSDLG